MFVLICIVSISAVSAASDVNDTSDSIQTTDELSVGGGASADDDLGESNLEASDLTADTDSAENNLGNSSPEESNKITVPSDDESQILTYEEIELEAEFYSDRWTPDIIVGDGVIGYVGIWADEIEGNLTVKINNETYFSEMVDEDMIELSIPDLGAGTYYVDIYYVDEVNELYGSLSTSFIVNKIKTKIEILNIDDDYNITSVLTAGGNAMGNTAVYYRIGDGEELSTVTDSEGMFVVGAMKDADVYIYFKGNETYSDYNTGISLKPLVLYVGENSGDNPDGSPENPYPGLIDAWKYVDDKNISIITDIIVNFYDGTYVFDIADINEVIANSKNNKGFILNRNMNVTLQAINSGNVDFKFAGDEFLDCDKFIFDLYSDKFIGLTYSGINFIFDNTGIFLGADGDNKGDLTFSGCSFFNFTAGFNAFSSNSNYRTLTDCYFDGNGVKDCIIYFMYDHMEFTKINYCSFYNVTGFTGPMYSNVVLRTNPYHGNLEANYNWWGYNNRQFSPPQIQGKVNADFFAVYNAELNYIGNNQFEVIGKLTWNDGTTDGIERLHAMPVSLTSDTGSFNDSNPVLKDGQFKVLYTADSQSNEVTTTLDGEVQTLRFDTVNVDVDVDDITYGDYANVTVNVPANINGNITVTVNNKSYSVSTNKTTVVIPINEILDSGIYTVDVIFSDADNNLYGSNSTTFEVKGLASKIKIISIDGYSMEIIGVLTDVDGNPIADAIVSYSLNAGEKVNVTANDKGEFIVSADDNTVVDMIFEGNNMYAGSNSTIALKNLKPVQKATMIDVPSTMTKTAVDYKAGEKGTMFYFYLRDADGKGLANKAIKIGIFDKIYTVKTDSNGRGGLQINIANANYYTYGISFLGDDDYKASFAVCSLEIVKKSVTITPAKTSYSFKTSAKTKTITATLKSTNSYIPKGKQVTLTIAGKTFKATIGGKGQINLNIGSITKKGTYKVAIKFAGTNTYAAATSKTITVKIS